MPKEKGCGYMELRLVEESRGLIPRYIIPKGKKEGAGMRQGLDSTTAQYHLSKKEPPPPSISLLINSHFIFYNHFPHPQHSQGQIVAQFPHLLPAHSSQALLSASIGRRPPYCKAHYGNTNYLFPPNNILQQKFNMATPNNFLNRYSPLPYGVGYAPWAITPQSLYTLGTGVHLGQLHQHLAFNYMQQLPFFTLPSLPLQNFPPILTTPSLQSRPRALLHEAPRSSLQNKIQKSRIKVSGGEVIEISDDSLPEQPQKSPQEKTLSTTLKTPLPELKKLPTHCPITPALVQELKQHLLPPPLPSRQPNKPKNKPQPKIPKLKEIYKPSHHKKRVDGRTNEATTGRRGAIFSQRIIQRKQTRIEPYRLSKKQRELLQIGLLRELTSEIMTGPQFQARLPPFLSAGRESETALQQWQKELREKLLERLEKNDE